MDTRIITILTMLALNFSTSFANDNVKYTEIRPVQPVLMKLAPVAPDVADFSDLIPETSASSAILIPVTPKEATFDDEIFSESVNSEKLPSILIPTTPNEADFEESI